MKRFVTALSLLCLALAGCRSTPFITDAEPPVVYRLRCGDTLSTDVYKEPDLSQSFQIGDDGVINFPLLGPVKVAGLSVAEVEVLLRALWGADYLVDPVVHVSVTNSEARPVMLFGEVRKPGAYAIPVGRRLTLLEVIAQAGGFTDIAARDRVRIVRVVNNKERSMNVRVSDLFRGRDDVTDIDLLAGDVIIVPETIF